MFGEMVRNLGFWALIALAFEFGYWLLCKIVSLHFPKLFLFQLYWTATVFLFFISGPEDRGRDTAEIASIALIFFLHYMLTDLQGIDNSELSDFRRPEKKKYHKG